MRNAPQRLAVLFAFSLVALTSTVAQAQPAVAEQGYEAAAAGELQTIAVVGLSSTDELLKKVRFLGQLIGNPQAAFMIEGTLGIYAQKLDKTKPIGLLLQTDGVQFAPLVCLPIDNLPGALEFLQQLQINSEELDNGIYEITAPQQIIYAKQKGSWVYVGQTEASLENPPADPTPLLKSLLTDYDIGARLLAQQVPQPFKDQAVNQLKGAVQAGLEQQPNETAEEYAARAKLAELQIQQLVDLINDLDEMTIGWKIDEQQEQTFLDVLVTAVPGSKMAEQLAPLKNSTTQLAGFVKPNASIVYRLSGKTSPDQAAAQAAQLETTLQAVRRQYATEIDNSEQLSSDRSRDLAKGVMSDLLDATLATSLSGDVDIAMSAKMSTSQMIAIGAVRMLETGKVESALRKLDELAQEEGVTAEYPGFKWNVARYADANFHTLTLPVPADNQQGVEMFGEEVTIAVGIAPEVVYFAAGKKSLPALRKAIEASQAAGEVATKPMEMSVSLSDLFAFANAVDDSSNPILAMLAGLLADSQGKDRIRLTVDAIDRGARYRLLLQPGVLKAIAAAQTAAQLQQQQPFDDGAF